MIASFFWLIAAIFTVLFLKALFAFFGKPKESHSTTFTAAVKHGEFQALVHYESESENPIAPSVQRVIGLWAIEREDRSYSREMHLALESELRHQFPSARSKVVSITLTARPEPEIEPVKLSRAERMDTQIVERVECVETLIERLTWVAESKPEVAAVSSSKAAPWSRRSKTSATTKPKTWRNSSKAK